MSRNKHGQSLVEYALGIGCVMTVCTLALMFIGHVYGDSSRSSSSAMKYNAQEGTNSGKSLVRKTAAAPWVLN